MRRLIRILIRIVGLLALGVALFIAVMWASEWRPAPVETVYALPGGESCDTLAGGDTLRILSWNIGYAGLGDDMDFFYDGGTRMRTTQPRTLVNLDGIISFLRSYRFDDRQPADIILLQEVDFDSRRSYRINEYDTLRTALPGYFGWWGLNYKTDFVPIPLTQPMGKVESGIVILSKWKPAEVTRYAYPGGFSFPVRLFNLKRCLLSMEIPVRDTIGSHAAARTLYVNNTHNTAYDTGNMRSEELAFLNAFLVGKRYTVTLGDWNSAPPGYIPSREAMEDKHFSPLQIARDDFPPDMTFVYDPTTPSVRYGYEPYNAATTTTTVIDFALCGPGLEPITFKTIDLGFKKSDHNPVVATFVIRD